MKCPYLTRTLTFIAHKEPFITEHEFEDTDGEISTSLFTTDGPTIDITTDQHTACIEDGCAAWYDGRCCYRG